jgi:hypothetical protein
MLSFRPEIVRFMFRKFLGGLSLGCRNIYRLLAELISSLLVSIQSYWTSAFILPKKLVRISEQKFNRFLWNRGSDGPARAKAS